MKKILIGIIAAAFMALPLVSSPALASNVDIYGACNGSNSEICKESKNQDVKKVVKPIIEFLLYIVGVLAVGMMIFGGIKYITSAGDSNKTGAAKNTILYAVIGLVVAIFAYGIVQFVYDRISSL
ncbi:hypothetical protein CR969_02115 [Candidatus Saccharibacteria bacterium]|nr:MAG: hypothetical protein CR969_02115 [Candidatus Saccharibacteria bacterium]